jgi:autotransporter adhesin
VDANGTLGRQAVATAQSVADIRLAMDHIAAVTDAQFNTLEGELGGRSFRLDEMDKSSRAGIAAAMAVGGMMVVPESNVSVSMNVATYRREQGFSGGISPRSSSRAW